MTKLEKEAEEKYCKGCKWRIEQCLWAWRKTNGLNEPNEKNCSCKEVPAYLAGAEPREKRIAELETRCNELFLQTIQLSKAKEIIKTFLAIVNNDVEYVQNPQDCKDLWKELCEKAEQFIKDSEVEK